MPTPDTSEVPQRLRDLLRRLNDRFLLVAAVSGRKPDEALKLIGHEDIVYSGNHGFEVLRDGGVRMIPEALPYLEKVKELENLARAELAPQGAFVEEKGITASIHYRNVPPEVGERCVELVRREGERLGLEVTVGLVAWSRRVQPYAPTRAQRSAPWSKNAAPREPCSSAMTPQASTPSASWKNCAVKND